MYNVFSCIYYSLSGRFSLPPDVENVFEKFKFMKLRGNYLYPTTRLDTLNESIIFKEKQQMLSPVIERNILWKRRLEKYL